MGILDTLLMGTDLLALRPLKGVCSYKQLMDVNISSLQSLCITERNVVVYFGLWPHEWPCSKGEKLIQSQ